MFSNNFYGSYWYGSFIAIFSHQPQNPFITGSEENEYKDESKYYIVEPGNAAAKLIMPTPKVIKAIFREKKEKVNTYFRQHREDAIGEIFLAGLI